MKTLKIFSDLSADETVLKTLRDGISPHELFLPFRPAKTVLAQSGPDPAIEKADIAFGQPDPAAVMAASNLRWVQVSSAGYTRYDTREFRGAAKERGLVVTNSSSVYAEACAEHVLSFMLAHARQLPAALRTRCINDSMQWDQLRGASSLLKNQRVLILGVGAIGSVLAPVLRALQMRITGFRRKTVGNEEVPIITEPDLAQELSKADHVINILPESCATREFMNKERFQCMKHGAVFYNIGRGRTVDQQALLCTLRSGRLAAAWLDVTDPEPLPADHPLLAAPNCFITPHTAGGHCREHENLVRHFLENFERFLDDSPLKDRVM